MLNSFIEHLENVGLQKEAQVIDFILKRHKAQKVKAKFLRNRLNRIRTASNLEWQITVIKTPDRVLTRQDIYNYYMEIRDRLLKELGGERLAVVRIDGADFVDMIDLGESLKDRRNSLNKLFADKMLTLYSVLGNSVNNFWIKLDAGKDFDFTNVKKVVPSIIDLVNSVPGTRRKPKTYFTGDNGFYVVGDLKEAQSLGVLRELLNEKLNEYAEDKTNIVVGSPADDQLGLDISDFKNTGSVPVPYSLNEKTGLVIVPVDNVDLFRKENAEIKRVLGHKPKNIELISSLRRLSASITEEMRDFFKERTNKHIGLVQKYCEEIEKSNPEKFRGLVERGEVHDQSKFEEPEKTPYVFITWKHKKNDDGEEFQIPSDINDNSATEHHVKSNRHHPEYYDEGAKINEKDRDKPSEKTVDATKMSDLDIAEMVADWLAMGEERGNTARSWADKNVNKRWRFTDNQKDLIYSIIDKIEPRHRKQLSSRQIKGLSIRAAFDPSKVSTTSANIGSIKIDTKLDTEKIKKALKYLQDKDYAAFAKARDFDYIISDITAKESGMNVPSGKAAWFNSAIPDVCFVVKSYTDSADEEQLASTILHEAQHGRYPGYGEWTAEHAEEKLATGRLLRKAKLVCIAQGFDPRNYAKELQKGFGDKAATIKEEAKKVKDRTSWSKFRSKYSEADVMRAYAFQVAIATLSKIFSTVDPELRLDIFNKVLYDPERKYGITKALISFDPTKEGAKSLNGYINDHINHGIINVLKELQPEVKEERLSERLDEGDEGAATKEQTLHEVGDLETTARELKETIDKIRDIISAQWKDDSLYGKPENAVGLFNYFISDIVTNPEVSDVFADETYSTRPEIVKKLGMEVPSMTCLDCGQKLVFEHDWQNKITKYEKTGCPQVKAAEHQVGWTDGVYNTEKAITDPNYKYRIGYERALGSGSYSEAAPIIAMLRGLSKFAIYEEEEESISATPELSTETFEETEEMIDEAERNNQYIKSLATDSYEYRRIKGLNFDRRTPVEDTDVADSVDNFNEVLDHFTTKLATSLTTAPYYEQFKEQVMELSNIIEGRQYKIR